MRRLYAFFGGRKVFQAYLFVLLVLGLCVAYWIWAEVPDFRWVVGPLSAALIGTQFSVAWEDRAQSVQQLASRLAGPSPTRRDDPEPGEQ